MPQNYYIGVLKFVYFMKYGRENNLKHPL